MSEILAEESRDIKKAGKGEGRQKNMKKIMQKGQN